MPLPSNVFVRNLKQVHGYTLVAGVDEVGCGCIAGPVVSAAVILADRCPLPSLNDSKKLSASLREKLSARIQTLATSWSIGESSVEEIEMLGIRPATLLASKRALLGLSIQPSAVVSDAFFIPELPYPCHPLVRADSHCRPVAAASIIAKVYRDQMMAEYEKTFPGYGFGVHKGYGTEMHLKALRGLGACALHRKTFAPVMAVMERGRE